MVNITEVTDKPETVTGTAGQQRSKPTNSNGIYNPYTKQFISLPNDTNHFQLASTHLRNQQASGTSHSATHAAWLNDQQYKFHVSNSDEELDAELLKLSVPEPTNEADPKETTLQANEPKEPPHRKRKCSDLGKNPQLGCSQIGDLQSGNFPDWSVTQIGDFSYIFSKSEVISPIWVVIPRSMIFHAGFLVKF